MEREEAVATIMRGDAELMALLTGGVYTDSEIGIQGLERGEDSLTEQAFDMLGELKPCAVVRESSEDPYAGIRDVGEKVVAITQAIEIYFYQHRERDIILAAKKRTYELLEHRRAGATYPLMWMGETPIFFDVGPVKNSSVLRQDWRCVFLRKPA